jgi:hypothetical protein
MRRLVLTAALLALAAGCTRSEEKAPARDGQLEPVPSPHQPGDFAPLPDPEAQAGSVGRAPRRLNVSQLDAAIFHAVGRRWITPDGRDGIDARASSLGRADYAFVVNENTEPNLVFAKFLEDGARLVCSLQAKDEVLLSDPEARVLSRTLPGRWDDLRKLTDTQVREFLVYNSTRFWGAPLTGDELTKWVGLFTQAATRVEAMNPKRRDQALAVVCIAMLTDSRFITY